MSQVFTAEERPFRRDNFDKTAWVVSIKPQERDNGDGTRNISVGFPVVVVTGWVNNADKFAARLAEILTEHYGEDK